MLYVHSRADSDEIPTPKVWIEQGKKSRLAFVLRMYNTTDGDFNGLHYDPLFSDSKWDERDANMELEDDAAQRNRSHDLRAVRGRSFEPKMQNLLIVRLLSLVVQ